MAAAHGSKPITANQPGSTLLVFSTTVAQLEVQLELRKLSLPVTVALLYYY